MQITQHLQKWGNGTGIRLSKKIVEAAKLGLGQSVAITMRGRSIILTPIKSETEELPTLDALLTGVTPEKIRGEMDWGQDRKQEVIDE